MAAEGFRASSGRAALAIAAALMAAPAFAAPAALNLDERCFDRVAVVLDDKPHHDPALTAREARAAAKGQPVEYSSDAHAILKLVLAQPRDCAGVAIDARAAPARPLALGEGAVGGFQGFGGTEATMTPDALAGATLATTASPSGRDAFLGFPVDGAPMMGPAAEGGLAAHQAPRTFGGRGAIALQGIPASGFAGAAAPRAGAAIPRDLTDDLTSLEPVQGDPLGGLTGATPAGIPEPSTWLLLVLGVLGAGAALRRRPSAAAG